MWPILILIGISVIVYIWNARRPLSPQEIENLVARRAFSAAEEFFGFSRSPVPINMEFKKAMEATGQFYRILVNVREFPSMAAALLKYKKHQWIVYGFVRDTQVILMWANKGPDRTKVWSFLLNEGIVEHARRHSAPTIIEIHNHPNSDPSRYSTDAPSEQDARNSKYDGTYFISKGIRYVGLVAERGSFHPFACWFPHGRHLTLQLRAEVNALNNQSGSLNAKLRRESRRRGEFQWYLSRENATHNLYDPPSPSDIAVEVRPQDSELQPERIGIDDPLVPKEKSYPVRRPLNIAVQMQPVSSPKIVSVGYSESGQAMVVQFRDGSRYSYFKISRELFREFNSAPLKEKWLDERTQQTGESRQRIS